VIPMYDKSKKTWSQRLKIHKNEKSSEANATRNIINNNSTASITTTTPTKTSVNNLQFPIEAGVLTTKTTKNPHQIVYEAAALNVAHNNANIVGSSSSSSSRVSMPQYQIAAPATVMHLPSPLGDYHASGAVGSQAYEYIPAHMGRSVKYAEPWIYGTVRGIPARRASNYHPAYVPYMGHPHAATIFAAASSNEMSPTVAAATPAVAVVLCSCPEYLSGTKGRTLKKPSICKKCKGTRLPLHNIGGTLRLPCNIPGPKLRPVGNAQTMRVVSSSKKIRPTILDPQKDPYDLMRRTRLLSPEPGALATGSSSVGNPGSSGSSSSKDKSRQRGKSASPVRGRSRTRHHKLLTSGSNSSKETLKALESFDDNWLTESEDLAALTASSKAAANNRKSILRCNVNPYDLISINNHTSAVDSPMTSKEGNRKSNRNQKLKFSQNEFMPPNDDFNVQDAALSEEDPPFLLRNQKTKEDSVKTESNKKLIEEPPPPSPLSQTQTQTQPQTPPASNEKGQNKNFNYVNVQAIAGQRISLGEEQQVRKPLLQQSADGTTITYENFSVETETQVASKDLEKSAKPRPDTLQVSLGEPKRPPRIGKQQQQTPVHEGKESPNNSKDLVLEDEDDLKVTVTVTPTYNIKSILKRPTSKISENGDAQSNEDSYKNVNVPTTTSKQRDPTNSSKSSTPTNSRRNPNSPGTPTANSQFYIPMPQARKKVQFLVEEYENTGSEDPDDDDEDDEEDGEDDYDIEAYYENRSLASSPSELKANYEYYNKKRHTEHLQGFDNAHTTHDSDAEVVTYDEQFIQAMLLEKLQLDSEMVSKRFNESQLTVEENDGKPTITTTTTTTTATAIVNKTDNEAEISNGSQRQQLENQKETADDDDDENDNDDKNNYDDEKNDKHYFNENPSNDTKTSLSLSTTSLMGALNNSATTMAMQSSTEEASSLLNCNVSLKSTTAMHMNNDDVYRRKTDDTDYSNGNVNSNSNSNSNDECLSSNDDNNSNSNSNDNNKKNDNIIIIQGLKECDNNTNGNSNSKNNSNSDNDNDYGQQQQHLSRNEGNKPTTCHHSDNNHHHHHNAQHRQQQQQQQQQQLDNVNIIDEDGNGDGNGVGDDVDNYEVNVTTPSPSPSFSSASTSSSTQSVSKVQQNGAKKSTTSDYDDDAKTKQQQQQQKQNQKHQQQQQQQNEKQEKKNFKKDMKQETLAAIAADSSSCNTTTSSSSSNSSCSSSSSSSTASNSNDSVSKNGSRKPTKETQSRNPIRRSQSERQPVTATTPTTTTAAAAIGKMATTYRNSNHKKKKDQQHQQQHQHQQQTKDFTDAHVATDNGDGNSGGCNENIISNTRNSLKDLKNIPKTTINDRRSATDCSTTSYTEEEGNRTTGRARGMSSKTSLHFHDTMALRNRYNRNDSRDLFQTTTTTRPREPPPPPPPQATALSAATLTTMLPQTCLETTLTAVDEGNAAITTPTALSNSLSMAEEDLKEPTKAITLATDAIETVLNGLASSNKQQIEQKLTITQATAAAYKENVVEKINETSLIEDAYQQQMVDITKTFNQWANKGKTNTDSASPHSAPTSPLPLATAMDNNSTLATTIWPTISSTSTTTIGHNKHQQQQQKHQQQRTVVRVAPFNKNSSEIHRLKISHTDNNETVSSTPSPSTNSSFCNSSHYSVTDLSLLNGSGCHEYGQKKTSILINGDDCYSTMNLSCDDNGTPLYQSSVVVTDGSCKVNNDNDFQGLRVTNTYNTVTINVSSPRSSEDELIQQHNQLNNLLKRQAKSATGTGSIRAIIPIRGTIDINLQRSASSTSSTSTSSMTSSCSSNSSSSGINTSKRGKTLIRLDYDKEKSPSTESKISSTLLNEQTPEEEESNIEEWLPHETELLKILRNPVEAVKRNLVPHICKLRETDTQKDSKRSKKMKERHSDILETSINSSTSTISTPKTPEMPSFIGKLLEDPMLQQVAEGLETDTVAELIENSLKRLQESRNSLDMSGTKDNDDMNRLIDLSLKRIQEERSCAQKDSATTPCHNSNLLSVPSNKDDERLSNRGSISSANSFASAHNYELFDFDANESDCYQSCSSDINSIMEEDISPSPNTKTKFYQMLVDATLQEIELSTNVEDLNNEEHQYESIRHHTDPIYEEISDVPPPLPLTAPPLNDPELEKKSARSIFEGASKYDILSYLVDAKERGLVKEESFDYPPLNCSNPIIIEEESADTLTDLSKLSKLKRIDTISSRSSIMSDSSDDNQSTMSSLSPPTSNNFMLLRPKQATSDIERNDSGVGSETSKTSRSKFLNPTTATNTSNSPLSSSPITAGGGAHSQPRSSPLHLCEDCDGPVETQIGENGHIFAPLVCRKCGKKRVERKEIITEVVETEEKYGRDLQIILEEFCHPMLVAGLLTQEQLSAIFLNTEELLENNQTLAERMRDALDIALEQGDDDLLTVNIGKIFLESTQMLHAFESYCVRQAGASLLLANLEKEKELLRIFLKVSQMENAVLRRMNLNSFLMVPVQRVTKYPLLLARLYKVTPSHLEGREQLKQAQEKIELHLNHINQEAKDVPTKLWRRISSSSPNRRASCEIDMINIKLRKMAIDVLEWNHDEVRFVMEGKLLYTQPTDSNWKKARTIKLTTVNALLVTNGKPSTNYKAEKVMSDKLNFPKHTGIREASLLVVKEKCGRYTLIREPLYLDRCVVCSEADWDEYFEIQEISSKDTFIFKAEDNVRTKQWYTQLQYHAQGMGAWRKRRNALANIMINGMLTRS
ncbi:hypothetical protein DOY81_007753, partial [Sarcophaga bullata]